MFHLLENSKQPKELELVDDLVFRANGKKKDNSSSRRALPKVCVKFKMRIKFVMEKCGMEFKNKKKHN